MAGGEIFAVLLGIAQDAGVPQAGCGCDRCEAANAGSAAGELVVSLGLVDTLEGKTWLVDATPDLRQQWYALRRVAPGCDLAGVLLTHAHIGHYAGLIHFGREAANTAALPVWCTDRMQRFLHGNEPWRSLITNANLDVRPLEPRTEMALSDGLSFEALPVPHRGELSDTVAYVLRGPGRSLLYCPDIDSWEQWDQDIRQLASRVDYALLDATFYDEHELPHRNLEDVPHPLAKTTANLLTGASGQVVLVHLNHTNPLLGSGAEREWIESLGHQVGSYLQRWIL